MAFLPSAKKLFVLQLFFILSLAGCHSDPADHLEVIEGKVFSYLSLSPVASPERRQGHVRMISLETDEKVNYHLIFLPESRYIDNNGEKELDVGLSLHVGSSGRYRCKGEKRTFDQYRADREKAGNMDPIRSISDIDYFFYVRELELLKIHTETSDKGENRKRVDNFLKNLSKKVKGTD